LGQYNPDITYDPVEDRFLVIWVEEHYRTPPYRVFSGHSFGGLFALNAFFSRPERYGAVISVSPVLNWDEDLPLRQAKK
jgi:predicted alpha/beta superfamily hydrolase